MATKKTAKNTTPKAKVPFTLKDFSKGRQELIEIILPGMGEDDNDGVVYMKKISTKRAFKLFGVSGDEKLRESMEMIIDTLCDADGNLIFDRDDEESVAAAYNMDPQLYHILSDPILEQIRQKEKEEDKEKNG